MWDIIPNFLLAFILASCLYKKHIKDWWLFKTGLGLYLAGVVGRLAAPYFSRWLPVAYTVFEIGGILCFLGSGVAVVVACLKGARLDTEHLRCLKCGYILKGLSEPRCPECGQAI